MITKAKIVSFQLNAYQMIKLTMKIKTSFGDQILKLINYTTLFKYILLPYKLITYITPFPLTKNALNITMLKE